MDSSVSDQNLFTRWFSKKSVRLLTLASVTVMILAILQVRQQQVNAPMQELLQGCKLKTRDLHRIQLAFGQSGLNDFKIKDGTVWVPCHQHSSYLTAANDLHAIPVELKLAQDSALGNADNPFLSRSQRAYREHLRQKHQIQEMVIRLPYVDQAWCEMDQPPRQNAFSTTHRSAVLSVQTAPECQLKVAHVDTIKQMVAGALTDLPIENIVVIDLNNGFAYQNNIDQLTQKQLELHQIAANQKRFYESRVQEILLDYPGVNVRVDVAVNEILVDVEPEAATTPLPIAQQATPPSAGANGVVSLEPEAPQQATVVPVPTEPRTTVELDKQLNIFVEVPTEALYVALGEPTERKKHFTAKTRQASIDQQTKVKFEQLKSTIIGRLLPLFPSESGAGSLLAEQGNSLDFKLLPAIVQAKPATTDWMSRAKTSFETNWPSLGVLAIGALLLTLVFRRSDQFQSSTDQYHPVVGSGSADSNAYELSIHGTNDGISVNQPETPNTPDAEVQLTKLIQEDPNSAAKIIETWIRDAA